MVLQQLQSSGRAASAIVTKQPSFRERGRHGKLPVDQAPRQLRHVGVLVTQLPLDYVLLNPPEDLLVIQGSPAPSSVSAAWEIAMTRFGSQGLGHALPPGVTKPLASCTSVLSQGPLKKVHKSAAAGSSCAQQ